MLFFQFLLALIAGLHVAQGQNACGYVRSAVCDPTSASASCYSGTTALGACQEFMAGGVSQGTGYTLCDASQMVAPMTGAGCATVGTRVPIASANGVCGAGCYASQQYYPAPNCGGVPAGILKPYTGGNCWNGQKVACDGNFFYQFNWDRTADITCPVIPTKTATVTKFPIGNCIDFSSAISNASLKVTGCSNPVPNAQSLMLTHMAIGIYTGATCASSTLLLEMGTTVGFCTMNSPGQYEKTFCDQGLWSINYGADSTCATPTSVSYFFETCIPAGVLGGSFGSAKAFKMSCTTALPPPTISFGANAQVGQLSIFSDAGCTQPMGGMYGVVSTCNSGSKVTCSSATTAVVEEYNVTVSPTCMGTPLSTTTYTTTTCVAMPNPDPTAPRMYAKLVSCGTASGPVDPANVPGRPTTTLRPTSATANTCGYLITPSPSPSGVPTVCDPMSATDNCYNSVSVLGVCSQYNFGGTQFGSGYSKCDNAMKISQTSGAACATVGTPAPISSFGNGQCGSDCYTTQMYFSTKGCMGTAAITSGRYTGGDCWNAQKVLCDASYFYTLSWDSADSMCPVTPTKAAQLVKIPTGGACIDLSGSTSNVSVKYTGCSNVMANAESMMTTSVVLGVYTNNLCGMSSLMYEVQQGFGVGANDCSKNMGMSGNIEYQKEYCDGGMWTFGYGSSATCALTALQSVTYLSEGCLPSTMFGVSIGAAKGLKVGCSATSRPPQFSFGTAKVGQLTLFSDSGCSTIIGGAYAKEGTCVGGTKVTCTTQSGVTVASAETWYDTVAGYQTCPGTASITTVYSSLCTKMPNSDPTAPAVYAKLVSCKAVTGTIDPGNAPGITLSGASSLWVVGVIYLVTLSLMLS